MELVDMTQDLLYSYSFLEQEVSVCEGHHLEHLKWRAAGTTASNIHMGCRLSLWGHREKEALWTHTLSLSKVPDYNRPGALGFKSASFSFYNIKDG